jgi:hypothetical protein
MNQLIKKLHLNKLRFRLFQLEKRERFAFVVITLTGGIFLSQLILSDIRFYLIIVLCILSYLLSYWALREDIKKVERFTLFVLPVFFTGIVSFFYFLLPERMITRVLTSVAFAVGMYAILLIENIYNVAAARSIQLLRAAHSVGFLMTLIVLYLCATVVYSLRLPFWSNFIIITPVSIILSLQFLWTAKLESSLTKPNILYSIIIGLGVGEMASVLSFWPILSPSFSLLLTAFFYTFAGIVQLHFLERLFKPAIREYIAVLICVFLLTYFTTPWGG